MKDWLMPTGDRIRHSILKRAPSSEAAVSFTNPPVHPASPLSFQPRTVGFVSAFAGTRAPASVTCVWEGDFPMKYIKNK